MPGPPLRGIAKIDIKPLRIRSVRRRTYTQALRPTPFAASLYCSMGPFHIGGRVYGKEGGAVGIKRCNHVGPDHLDANMWEKAAHLHVGAVKLCLKGTQTGAAVERIQALA